MTPLVSILIPVYNRVSLVSETIDSARNQTYENIEIIVVDNCSTDGTWELLEEFARRDSRIRIFQNSENIGPVMNWKRCIDEASGEYGKILFSDDLISQNFIEETLNCFDEKTAFVLANIQVFGDSNKNIFSKFCEKDEFASSEYFYNVLLVNHYGFPVSPGGGLFRLNDLRDSLIVDISNPFNLDFQQFGAGNDLLLFLNTAMRYSKIRIAKNTTAFFRSHDQSFSIKNKLSIFYEYSKLDFIRNHLFCLKPKFKAITWLRLLKNNDNSFFYHYIEGKIDFIFLLKILFVKKILK